ncbi:MAG TPA: hypothetical protein VJN93_01940 [Candidatus Acidoferrum sp.]|nr:hypothetical protein [Candidatus Acidoferrum sp.]
MDGAVPAQDRVAQVLVLVVVWVAQAVAQVLVPGLAVAVLVAGLVQGVVLDWEAPAVALVAAEFRRSPLENGSRQ